MNWKPIVMAIGVAGIAAPAAAQQQRGMHPGGMPGMQGMQGMPMMDSMMAPMMQAMASSPEHLLAMKDRLHLTPAQETQLAALRDAAKGAHDAAASQAAMHMREMVQVMRTATPDTVAVKTHLDAAMRFCETAHWAMVRGAAQAWPLLTDAQRSQVTAMADSMGKGGMMMHPAPARRS